MGRRLEKQVAVITGAGQGVGEAYAMAFAAAGARVVVNDINRANADAVVERIRENGGDACANHDDIVAFSGAERLIDQAEKAFGAIDILVANAGIIRPVLLHEANEDDWTSVLAVHATGTFNCYRHAAPRMIPRGKGAIITTGAGSGEGSGSGSGVAAQAGFPGLGSYRAAKAAILVFTLYAARELEPYGITVNSIMPGATATAMQQTFYDGLKKKSLLKEDWPQPVPPSSVPPLGLFLCSEYGKHITGQAFSLHKTEIHRTEIRVATAPTKTSSIFTEGDQWTVEELIERAPAWLE